MDNILKINKISNKIPIYLFSGSKDKIYNIKFQDISLNKLREKKYKIFWFIKKLHHCEYSKYEQHFLFNSINDILAYNYYLYIFFLYIIVIISIILNIVYF